MEDLFQVLLILGFIGFGIFKQISKHNAEKTHVPPIPQPEAEDSYPQTAYYDLPPTPPPAISKPLKNDKFKNRAEFREGRKSPLHEEVEMNTEFNIHSVEEVRKGIIWSEILNRKY